MTPSARKGRGRFITGNSGGPGRPKGSRNRLGEDFLGVLFADWSENGRHISTSDTYVRVALAFIVMPRRFVETQKGPIGPLRQANRRADYAPAPGNLDSSIAFLDSLASIPALPLDQRWNSVSSKATCSTSSAASSLYKSCSAEPSGTALARLLKKSTARFSNVMRTFARRCPPDRPGNARDRAQLSAKASARRSRQSRHHQGKVAQLKKAEQHWPWR